MKRSIITATLALATLLSTEPTPAAGGTMDTFITLVDFGDDDRSEWFAINDVVMGGVSNGKIAVTAQETGIFSGVLSLENNGGFASVRAVVEHRDLSNYAGLEVRVRGDGRTYQLRLRTDDRFDGIAYQTFFETRDGEWMTFKRAFDDFRPTFRGRTPGNAPPLDLAHIQQVGFLLADKKPGKFMLEIDFVRTIADVSGKP